MNDYLIFAIGFLGFAGFLGIIETVSRRLSLKHEFTRRISHTFAAIFTAFFSLHLSAPFLLIGLGIFSIIMFLSRLLKIFSHIHGVSRFTIGEEFLPLGFIVSYLIAKGESSIFIPTVLVVGIADPLAGLVFSRYKNHILRILAFAIPAFLLLLTSSNTSISQAISIAVIVSLIEKISPYGTDNLSIPVSTALLLKIL